MSALISISVIRNEEDIVEAWIRHHCALVDHMFITLHDCTDATEGIITLLQEEGLPVTTYRHHDFAHTQHTLLTDVLRNQIENGYDGWILPLDGDEFLRVPEGSAISEILDSTPSDVVALLPWQTYVPTEFDSNNEPHVLRRMQYRIASEGTQYTKALISPQIARVPSVSIGPGSHHAMNADGTCVQGVLHPTLHLAHFPVRSDAQLRRKVHEGCSRLKANPLRLPHEGWHWEKLSHQLSQHSAALSMQELNTIACTYASETGGIPPLVHDAIRTNDDLRYAPTLCA